MYRIDIDRQNAFIEFVLDGLIRKEEMERFVEELKAAGRSLPGREIKVLADLRTIRPASPEAADLLRGAQRFGLQNGVKRVVELVESEVVALQLNRVARESGMEKILRRFTDEAAARRWLLTGEE